MQRMQGADVPMAGQIKLLRIPIGQILDSPPMEILEKQFLIFSMEGLGYT